MFTCTMCSSTAMQFLTLVAPALRLLGAGLFASARDCVVLVCMNNSPQCICRWLRCQNEFSEPSAASRR